MSIWSETIDRSHSSWTAFGKVSARLSIDSLVPPRYPFSYECGPPQELEELVQSKVKSGRYSSASEVVREALQLMDERDQMLVFRKDEIREKIAEGLDSLRQVKAAMVISSSIASKRSWIQWSAPATNEGVHPLAGG